MRACLKLIQSWFLWPRKVARPIGLSIRFERGVLLGMEPEPFSELAELMVITGGGQRRNYKLTRVGLSWLSRN